MARTPKKSTPHRKRIVLVGRKDFKRVWATVDGKRTSVELLRRKTPNVFEARLTGTTKKLELRRRDLPNYK